MINESKAFSEAKWIWRNSEAKCDEYTDFADNFTVNKKTNEHFYLNIAADSNYTVYINGIMAAFGQYADYPTYKVYDRIDITDKIKNGENRIVLTVWYYGIGSFTYKCGIAGLIYEISDDENEVIAYSSENTLSRLAKDYISGTKRRISNQLGLTYHYDMKQYDGFRNENKEDFANSREIDNISTDFHIRPNEKLVLENRIKGTICRKGIFRYKDVYDDPAKTMQMSYVTTGYLTVKDENGTTVLKKYDKDTDGIYFIVDLGEESAGFLDFDMEVPKECHMDVGYGEHLEDGICRTAIRGFSCDIELKKGRNDFLNTFRRFGCRYLQFFVQADEVKIFYAGLRPVIYPFKHKKYESGNILRDRIYKVCENTLQHCYHEHYEDCPWREQALYTMDSRNQMLCGYYAFNEFKAARASLELISHGQRGDGLLMLCYPAENDAPIPAFSCMYFVQMYEYMKYSKDKTLFLKHRDLLESILNTFEKRKTEEGIIENFYGPDERGKTEYWNFYEWAPTMSGNFGSTERHLESPINAFYSLALKSMAKMCNEVKDYEFAEKYAERAEKLNKAIKNKFYNEESGYFETFDDIHKGEYSVLTQSLCMLCGAGKYADNSKMLKAMAQNGGNVDGRYIIPNTLSMNAFRFDALIEKDKEKYSKVILDEIDRDYFYMLNKGATTFWETIEGEKDFDGAGSLCHGWSALPIYYYEILGDKNK